MPCQAGIPLLRKTGCRVPLAVSFGEKVLLMRNERRYNLLWPGQPGLNKYRELSMKRYVFLLLLVLGVMFLPEQARSFDFFTILQNGPLLTINRDRDGVFQSVTVYAIVNAPLDRVWDTVLDIDSYREYMPRVIEARVLKRNPGAGITARFEIEVPMRNTRYELKFSPDREKKSIAVGRLSGDLEGSSWQWQFEDMGEKTMIIYRGVIRNYSSFLQRFDDREQTITVGINISTLLATVKSIKERSELLWRSRPRAKPSP